MTHAVYVGVFLCILERERVWHLYLHPAGHHPRISHNLHSQSVSTIDRTEVNSRVEYGLCIICACVCERKRKRERENKDVIMDQLGFS